MFKQDVYIEQLVKRKNNAASILIRVGIILGAVVVGAAIIVFAPLAGPFSSILFLIFGLLIYGSYLAFVSQSVEYEYIITNGDIDIDKIIAQRRRKRILSFKCRDIDKMGRYDAKEHASTEYNKKYFVQDAADENPWYLAYTSPKHGRVLVVFSGYERILNAMRPFLTRELIMNVFVNRQV